MSKAVPFYRHDLGKPELDAIANVFAGAILTTGDYVADFESAFAEYMNAKFAIGVTSCTGALHISLLGLGIGPGDEVITTPMTFIASATAIIESGATPVFVDVEEDTGNIDATKIEAAITKKTKAILPVHLYGQMCDMIAIRKIADKHNLKIVEDCAHCIEGARDGVRPGQLSDAACFSFFATKNITCGEGGAVVTNSEILKSKLLLLRHHGMNKTAADRFREGYQHWDMVTLGWKYNMDNIQAAILLPQMKRIAENLEKRLSLASRYEIAFKDLSPDLKVTATKSNCLHARHLFPIWVAKEKRDKLIAYLYSKGINVVVNYRAIHLLTYFKNNYGFEVGQFPKAEQIGDSTISLPLYPKMPLEDQQTVISEIKRFFNE